MSKVDLLAKLNSVPSASVDMVELLRQRAWHELGLAIFRPDEIANEWLREGLRGEAEKRYGRRRV